MASRSKKAAQAKVKVVNRGQNRGVIKPSPEGPEAKRLMEKITPDRGHGPNIERDAWDFDKETGVSKKAGSKKSKKRKVSGMKKMTPRSRS